jgi:hypothetical protein
MIFTLSSGFTGWVEPVKKAVNKDLSSQEFYPAQKRT